MTINWPAGSLKRAEEMWKAGTSARLIAAECGVSKNSIIGMAHREGWGSHAGAVFKQHFWTAELDDKLRALRATDLSLVQIAKTMGLSRSAIGSRSYKLGLAKRNVSDAMRKFHARRQGASNPVPRAPRVASAEIFPPSPETQVSLMDAKPFQCRFIIGESNGPETVFCGAPGRPWCAFHRRLVYQPVSRPARPYVPGRVSA